jgi:hypothetical protein
MVSHFLTTVKLSMRLTDVTLGLIMVLWLGE